LQIGEAGCGFAPFLFDVINTARRWATLAAVEQGTFFRNEPLLVSIQARLIEGAPAECVVGFDNFVESFAFALAHGDRITNAEVAAHDFKQCLASSADFRCETLADDPANGISQAKPNLLLLFLLEHAENTVDRLPGIDRVQRAD